MNILVNEFHINNDNYLIEHNDNNVFLKKKNNIRSEIMHSFGIFPKINPFLCKNKFEATLEFNYEFSDNCNIKIYNGKKWIHFDNNRKGKINETIILEGGIFTNFTSKWRIGFTNNIDKINLTNIKLTVDFPDKPNLLLIGSSVWKILDLNTISDFNTLNCYYFDKFLRKKYNIIHCSIEELLKNMYYLNFDIECSIITTLEGLCKSGCLKWEKRIYLKNKLWTDELFNYFFSRVKKILISTDWVNDDYIMDNSTFNKFCYFIVGQDLVTDKYKEKVCLVYWAADDEIFYPKKDKEKFVILIDDCDYGEENYKEGRKRKNYEILDYCIDIMNKNEFVHVYRFGYCDKGRNFIDKYKNKYSRYKVIDKKIPITKKTEYHNIANVFWATHKESLGICNIESSMSGALLVHPKGFIRKHLTKYLNHIDYDNINEITIEKLMESDKPLEQREKALEFTWEKKCEKILKFLQ